MDLSADANHKGFPQISAPTLSATYSLLRLIAIWINEAAKGARIIIAIRPMNPVLLFLRPPIWYATGIVDCALAWAAVVYQDEPITKIRRDKDSYLQ